MSIVFTIFFLILVFALALPIVGGLHLVANWRGWYSQPITPSKFSLYITTLYYLG